jgi:uncharacterized protein YecE (DUF72 family)
MIKVGCCDYPVSRPAYYGRFSTVEVNSTFYALPRLSTAERWREEAPRDFDFSVKAWQLVTHPSSSPTYLKVRPKQDPRRLERCGHFRATDETAEAWEKFLAVARVLKPRFVLFQTPASFYPNPDHLRDMYRFFKRIPREWSLVWEPRAGWEPDMVRRVCRDLGLVRGLDPLYDEPDRDGVRYFRLHGTRQGRRIVYAHAFGDEELRKALARCAGGPAYVYFNNVSMWEDAQRFDRLALGDLPYRPASRRMGGRA